MGVLLLATEPLRAWLYDVIIVYYKKFIDKRRKAVNKVLRYWLELIFAVMAVSVAAGIVMVAIIAMRP